ncbi:hypothetical protein L1887_09018 [Cichorium endivia]|nr:hypothetical protein L1887_09018 [Cichorium endivia]
MINLVSKSILGLVSFFVLSGLKISENMINTFPSNLKIIDLLANGNMGCCDCWGQMLKGINQHREEI